MSSNRNPITECIRCGSCCKRGGPCFHGADRRLIENGVIPLKHLYTIRQGEPVYDNVRRRLVASETDIIKIKERKKSRACLFFEEAGNRCRIYENRPSECRLLTCWDTREMERGYDKDRLSREALISGVEGLWELVSDHQARCDYKKIENLLGNSNASNKQETLESILYLVQYDAQLRSLIIEKGGIDPEMIDFLLGAPLYETLARFGITVKTEGGAYRLKLSPEDNAYRIRWETSGPRYGR